MAHFYGHINGAARSPVTRAGTKASGLESHIRGAHVGVRVYVFFDEGTDSDIIEVWGTSGSIGQDHGRPETLLLRWSSPCGQHNPELDMVADWIVAHVSPTTDAILEPEGDANNV